MMTKNKIVYPHRRVAYSTQMLQGSTLHYNASIQAKYIAALRKLIKPLLSQTKNEVIRLYKSQIVTDSKMAMDAAPVNEFKKLINSLTFKFDILFGHKAKKIVADMIKATNKVSQSNLKASLKELSGGLVIDMGKVSKSLKKIMERATDENVDLITSISKKYLGQIKKTVLNSVTKKDGLETLIPALERYDGVTHRRAKNIALDQTRKLYNGMNATRMKESGVEEFMWIHSGGGQQPRRSHMAMNGDVFRLDDLPIINQEQVQKGYEEPITGKPGDTYNCGCTMKPIVNFKSRV